jgi:hypothetical protein
MIRGLRWYGIVGAVGFVASFVLMRLGIDPFYRRFYDFAWYSYILLADALIYRWRGRSLLSNYFGEFLLMLPLSFFIWEIFEGFDLVMNNWYYVEIVSGLPVPLPYSNWNIPHYFIAFATVLPGEFVTVELIRIWSERPGNPISRARWTPFELTQTKFDVFIALGCLGIFLPLVWPKQFFPLAWLWAFFIFDPINYRAGRPSILYELSKGRWALLVQLLIAGMICGGLWEFWNFWAGTKWIYTVPWPFNKMKLFEMPFLGFFGFPPFALECFALYHFLRDFPGIRRLAGKRSLFAFGMPEQEHTEV